MGSSEFSTFKTVVDGLNTSSITGWRNTAQNVKLLCDVYIDKTNTRWRASYKEGAKDLFRFLRNLYVYGTEKTIENDVQKMANTDELEHMAAHHFSDFIADLLYNLVLELDMSGRLQKAWDDYTQ